VVGIGAAKVLSVVTLIFTAGIVARTAGVRRMKAIGVGSGKALRGVDLTLPSADY